MPITSLDERVDTWMADISAKIQDLEQRCEAKIGSMPPIPEYSQNMSDEEYDVLWEEESRRDALRGRKGLSKEEWDDLREEIDRKRLEFWKEFHETQEADYCNAYMLQTIRFKLKWMAFYFENFGHCVEGWHVTRQMKLAERLIQIVTMSGLDDDEPPTIPYVNLGNKDRFYDFNDWHQPFYKLGEAQEVRFHKAYCLFWKLMKDNFLSWWD